MKTINPKKAAKVARAKLRGMLYCDLCKRIVKGGLHPCIAEDGSGRPDEHLAMCHACGTFHEPHCGPLDPFLEATEGADWKRVQ